MNPKVMDKATVRDHIWEAGKYTVFAPLYVTAGNIVRILGVDDGDTSGAKALVTGFLKPKGAGIPFGFDPFETTNGMGDGSANLAVHIIRCKLTQIIHGPHAAEADCNNPERSLDFAGALSSIIDRLALE